MDHQFGDLVKLSAASALGLTSDLHDAVVLMDSLARNGVIDISIPEHSIMTSISGEDFMIRLRRAFQNFDIGNTDEEWKILSRDEVAAAGGVVDDLTGSIKVFYRIVNPDGTVPSPPTLTQSGDKVILYD